MTSLSPSPLLLVIRDIYIRCVAKLADQLLQEHIEKYCLGCRRASCKGWKSAPHDLCVSLSWASRVIAFLPNILRHLTTADILPSFRVIFNRMEPRFTQDEIKSFPNPFNVTTCVYIFLDEMHACVAIETSIAQSIYSMYRRGNDGDVESFGKRYQEAVSRNRKLQPILSPPPLSPPQSMQKMVAEDIEEEAAAGTSPKLVGRW